MILSRNLISAAILAGFLAGPAFAQAPAPAPATPPAPASRGIEPSTGDELVKGCRARLAVDSQSGEKKLQGGRCKDYLFGFFTRQKDNQNPRPEEIFCTNGVVSFGKIAEIVIDHARDRPEMLQGSADDLVMSAMHTTFPCANKTPQE